MATVELDGMTLVISNIDKITPELEAAIDQALQEAGLETEAEAKMRCPVDTGRLRASIQSHPGHLETTVSTNVEYAPYVEFGTSRMRAQPYLFPAFQKASASLEGKLKAL